MDLKELDSFKMSDAIAFHDQLNPKLFHGKYLRPDVDEQLQVIAQDFLSELGIRDLDVKDVTISGSNAAYSYTPNSDLDLHILVDLSQYSDDAVYQELFQAKKNLYNDSHDITINGIPVELYIQDANEPVVSLGEYSILQNKWLRLPSKRRSNLDQTATKQKYEKLSKVAEYALHTKDLSKLKKVLETIKRYRQAGLDFGGEFGPENLAYKMLRSQGIITKLYDLRDKLHSQRLSIEGMYSVEEADEKMYKHTPTVEQLVIKYKVPKRDILIQLDKGIKVELEHTSERNIARKIALDHIGEDPHYYNKLEKANLEESFDKPYELLRWEKGDFGDIDAIARLDDNTFLSIMFNKGYSKDSKEEVWSVEFYRNNSQEVTGEGDAQRVFATVLTSIQSFIKKYAPNKVMFAASKEADDGQNSQSRARLYDSLVQRYAKSWGFRAFRAETGNKVFYELTRRDPVAETLDDPWGDQGNFAGDKPVNIGGDTVKRLEVGDIVLYLGQKAKILAQSKPEGKYSRITIASDFGGTTKDVLTSDLKRLSKGMAETASTAMANTATRLANKDDGKVAKLRTAGDQRREEQLKGRNIAKRDTTNKDEWGNVKESTTNVSKSVDYLEEK
jgi:hypothetical protein